jgi:hypothetical protein
MKTWSAIRRLAISENRSAGWYFESNDKIFLPNIPAKAGGYLCAYVQSPYDLILFCQTHTESFFQPDATFRLRANNFSGQPVDHSKKETPIYITFYNKVVEELV